MADLDNLEQQFEDSVNIIKQVANGDETTTVNLPSGGTVRSLRKLQKDAQDELDTAVDLFGANKVDKSSTNAADGIVGLIGFKAVLKNATGAFKALLSFAGTADRAIDFQDKDGTVAFVSDITDRMGVANGLATLDGNGLIPAVQLPSYVDDVIEVATKAALPATGEAGKIYIVLADESRSNTLSQYRWGGSAYSRIVSAPGSTDEVAEGAANKYFTESRVLAAILAGFSTATNAAVTAADSVLVAIGKLQAQVTANGVYAKTYDFHGFVPGKPTASATLLFVRAGRAFTLPAGLTGSQFKAKTAATASTTITLYKNGAAFGTLVWAAGGVTPTVTAASATSFAAGDELTVVAPATQDTTLADVALTLLGSQN
jgi:hypothetical protein